MKYLAAALWFGLIFSIVSFLVITFIYEFAAGIYMLMCVCIIGLLYVNSRPKP